MIQNKKIRLLFFVPSLGNGGAEKHTLRLINNLNYELFNIHIAVARAGGSYESQLSNHIKIYQLNHKIKSSSLSMIFSIKKLGRLIKDIGPDFIISFLTHSIITTSLALNKKTYPFLIGCVQNNYSKESQKRPYILRQIFNQVLHSAFKKAKAVVVLSKGVEKDLVENFISIKQKCHVIFNACYNGVNHPPDKRKPNAVFSIVACGRLELQKDYPTMIRAFNEVLSKGLKANLTILGRGRLKDKLQRMTRKLHLEDRIKFVGFQSQPDRFLRDADLFLLTSDYEGFGNVIVEAMAQGTPVMSTDCEFGPDEIIEHKKNGILVPVGDHVTIAKEIIKIAADENLRNRIAVNGYKSSLKFSAQKISKEYENLFLKLAETT